MTKGYAFLEDVATADLAIKVCGKDLNELFRNAALAIGEATVDPKTVTARDTVEFHLEGEEIEALLFDFLSEIIFKKDADQMVFNECRVFVEGEEGAWRLHATLEGEKINRKRHKLDFDIKAVTMHMFKVKKTKEGYEATIVVDV